MERIAIIGTGIAGLGCARQLQGRAHLTLFERESWVGGHTNTVEVTAHPGDQGGADGDRVPIDTGFMVFNRVTYPRLCALFDELDVPIKPTSMSFGVHHVGEGLAYASGGLAELFAQPQNALSPGFWGMVRDITRFNRRAQETLDDKTAHGLSLATFLERERLGRRFRDHYLVPMTGAIWSTPPDRMLDFPAATLFRFMSNHGLLRMKGHHPWYTVDGGSRAYRERLIAPFRDRIATGRAATRVERLPGKGVTVICERGAQETFDRVVIATHADEALALLAVPTSDERRLLGVFRYQKNPVLLHTDAGVMPRARRAWASWNYRLDPAENGGVRASTHYWMNNLQGVSETQDYFVSVDDPGLVDLEKVLWSHTYTHPTFDEATAAAQPELPHLNATGPIYFAGSYFRYGFHEDALMAGQAAAEAVCAHLSPHAVVTL